MDKNLNKKEPTFKVKVQNDGKIVISSIYTRMMGISEGQNPEFEIKLSYKNIHLKQID